MPYTLGSVVGVNVFKNDVEVVREGRALPVEYAPRGMVKEFSWASRRRLAFVASNTAVDFRTMVTLTYPRQFPSDGRKVKRDLNAFLVWFKRDRGAFSYLWFLEFQRRGAPHIHLLTSSQFPKGKKGAKGLRFRVSAVWYRLVGSGDSRHLGAGTRVERVRTCEGAKRYAVKYAMKMRQKRVPPAYRNVGRFWGASRDVKPTSQGFVRCTEDDIRGAIADWEYRPQDDRLVWRVLYNQAGAFRCHLDNGFDKTGARVYNRAERDERD